jgi:hypothetical protein
MHKRLDCAGYGGLSRGIRSVRQGSPATIWATWSGGLEPWRTAASQEGCQFPAGDKGKGKEISLLATFNV